MENKKTIVHVNTEEYIPALSLIAKNLGEDEESDKNLYTPSSWFDDEIIDAQESDICDALGIHDISGVKMSMYTCYIQKQKPDCAYIVMNSACIKLGYSC